MSQVYKYEVPFVVAELVSVRMPRGAKVLTLQVQSSKLMCWAIVNPDAPLARHDFLCVGTGNGEPSGVYVATIQKETCEWHFFDLGEATNA